MRDRRFLRSKKPGSPQRPAFAAKIFATTCIEEKSLMALYYELPDLDKTKRFTLQPVRRHTLAISWMETDELLLEIT